MSNIDRKYDYHDDGVLPAQGEYGVTYLTLYSSGAGNAYDGWIWDPDRINYSETARTFGYRNPSYPDYCWDDEVVVDLSNAQTRQESSDFEQGRITSFNTNVSNVPIVINDIDVTGMTEDEREAKATTILFTAIPLVKDSYIHAEVEVQMKMNLSPNNTTGNIRVEAFYILNDESDRTMRPHPVNHYTVTRDDEYNILRLLYWNPALKHEVSNYIGVKLIVTGGTVEIGISDNPEYGDAIITVSSAGMTGDNIYSPDTERPMYITLTGKQLVPCGYKINLDDYTVICTCDSGNTYDVTRLCTFNPNVDYPITESVTTLTATYMNLFDSIDLYLAMVEHIELSGLTDVYGEYNLSIEDFEVLAYFDNDDVWDVKDQCSFEPIMGYKVEDDIVLTATYQPAYMQGSIFTDSLSITKHSGSEPVPSGGLIYTLYDDNTVEITGNADTIYERGIFWDGHHDTIAFPSEISEALEERQANYTVKWNAEGSISGIRLESYADHNDPNNRYSCSGLINFKDVKIKPFYFARQEPHYDWQINNIILNFSNQKLLTSNDLSFLKNIDFKSVDGVPTVLSSGGDPTYIYSVPGFGIVSQSYGCGGMFYNCKSLESVWFAENWNLSLVESTSQMFYGCESLRSLSPLHNWNVKNVYDASSMFERSGIYSFNGLQNWNIGSLSKVRSGNNRVILNSMFSGCNNVESTSGMEYFIKNKNRSYDISYMFSSCENLVSTESLETWYTAKIEYVSSLFFKCHKLIDIHGVSSWNSDEFIDASLAFSDTGLRSTISLISWGLQNIAVYPKVHSIIGGFKASPPYYTRLIMETVADCSMLNAMYDPNKKWYDYISSQIYTDSETGEEYHAPTNDYFYTWSHGDIVEDLDPYCAETTNDGLFKGIDLHGSVRTASKPVEDEQGHVFVPPYTVVIWFAFPEKLPDWYKNALLEGLIEEETHRTHHQMSGYISTHDPVPHEET